MCKLSWSYLLLTKLNFMFLCSAVSCPLDRSKRFALFLPWQTFSSRHQLGLSWKHSSHAAITHNDYSLTFPQLHIARNSFIQLNEQGRQWIKRKFPIFEIVGQPNPFNEAPLFCFSNGNIGLKYLKQHNVSCQCMHFNTRCRNRNDNRGCMVPRAS